MDSVRKRYGMTYQGLGQKNRTQENIKRSAAAWSDCPLPYAMDPSPNGESISTDLEFDSGGTCLFGGCQDCFFGVHARMIGTVHIDWYCQVT